MADTKPDIADGYLGPQEGFSKLGITPLTHPHRAGTEQGKEILVRENQLEIKFQVTIPVKFTHQLISCKTGKEISEYAFTHTKENVATFVVHLPETGYYKLQLFALPLADSSKGLPNIYNYLIHCTRVSSIARTFPKQFARWKEGCFLISPQCIYKDMPTLGNIHWHVLVPHANAVAVMVDDEWYHFEHRGGPVFEAHFGLENAVGKRITLNANFDKKDENQFLALLEYHL